MTDKPTRRELLRPLQLLGLAFAASLFAGVVTLVSMGFFQDGGGDQRQRALVAAGVALGVTFIVVLVVVALLLLAIDPAQVQKQIDRPVLLPQDPADDADHTPPASAPDRPDAGAPPSEPRP